MKFNYCLIVWGACLLGVNCKSIRDYRVLPSVVLPVLASTGAVESDKVYFHYSSPPLLIGNDGSAEKGGLHVYSLSDEKEAKLNEAWSKVTGRTKVVSVVYSVDKKDYVVTFSTPEHLLRFYDIDSGKELKAATKVILAEFSALCGWRSPITGEQYIYLFGKKEVRMYILQTTKRSFEAVEVTRFVLPLEAETCAVPLGQSIVIFGGADKKIYSFPASDVPTKAEVTTILETEEEIVGAAVYHSTLNDYSFFVAFEGSISVYSKTFENIGTISIDGGEGFELSDIAILQRGDKANSRGFIGYAFESDEFGKTFGLSSLGPIFNGLNIRPNTSFDPRKHNSGKSPRCPAVRNCSNGGICTSKNTCKCYTGFTGADCSKITCENNCNGNGKCVAANQCDCKSPFTGDDCSTLSVTAKYETEANGADGDDPAIWIAPVAKNSRIITTTKSEDNPGLTVFDLNGRLIQSVSAEEPNNVDIVYDFPISDTKRIDLAYAGCRGDNTLCLLQIDHAGNVSSIAGGSQPLPKDFEPYGSCVFHRARDEKHFLFVNSKKARYLQYELTAKNSTLVTTLVREFEIGTGTQPEGCVVDDSNEVIFIGEEQYGIWKYGANPEDPGTGAGILVDSVDKAAGGKLNADVEGMALVYGKVKEEGYLMVSTQGVSAYNIYQRAPPHKFVMTFSIGDNKIGGVDHVTNTDGVAAVGTNVGGLFRNGLLVVHDDANERPDGTTDAAASFKLVSLGDVLPGKLGKTVDNSYDPRSAA